MGFPVRCQRQFTWPGPYAESEGCEPGGTFRKSDDKQPYVIKTTLTCLRRKRRPTHQGGSPQSFYFNVKITAWREPLAPHAPWRSKWMRTTALRRCPRLRWCRRRPRGARTAPGSGGPRTQWTAAVCWAPAGNHRRWWRNPARKPRDCAGEWYRGREVDGKNGERVGVGSFTILYLGEK